MSTPTPSRPSSIAAQIPAGPPPIDEHLDLELLDLVGRLRRARRRREPGAPSQLVDRHAGLHRGHAGFHRAAVRHHRALRALAVDAEDPLRAAVLAVMTEDGDPRGVERGRDHLALSRLERRPVEREIDRLHRKRREYRMRDDPAIGLLRRLVELRCGGLPLRRVYLRCASSASPFVLERPERRPRPTCPARPRSGKGIRISPGADSCHAPSRAMTFFCAIVRRQSVRSGRRAGLRRRALFALRA